MFQASQQRTAAVLFGKHEVFDIHNAGNSIFGIAEKLHTNCACVHRHAVHNPACAGDEAITAFFLNTWQLVCDVFA